MGKIHFGVMDRGSGKFLRMTKFDPTTGAPRYGPLEASWIANSKTQAIAQAGLLGNDTHVAVEYSDEDQEHLQKEGEVDAPR